MGEINFKERVRQAAIAGAKEYKDKYLDYEYLICSDAFQNKKYYIVSAEETNYQHLLGVHSLISAQKFFDKCYKGTLEESDFDFIKKGQSEKSIKGSVRRKINVLPNMLKMFEGALRVEEDFKKNKVVCSFASTDAVCTLGFIENGKSRPKSLIKGDEVDSKKGKEVTLLLRKRSEEEKFHEILIGNNEIILKYINILTPELY